jgi:hypothetical protein
MGNRKPKWHVWKLAPKVELWEAVSLSLDLEPSTVWRRTYSAMGEPAPFNYSQSDEFSDRLDVVCRNVERLTGHRDSGEFNLHQQTALAEFARFAVSVGWGIPEEMQGLVPPRWEYHLVQDSWTLEQAAQLLCGQEPAGLGFDRADTTPGGPNDIYSRMKGAKDQGRLNVAKSRTGGNLIRFGRVKPSEVVAWAKSIGWTIPEPLLQLASEPKRLDEDRPLERRERNTLLSMIAALASVGGVDLTSASKAAGIVESASEKLGCRVARRTAEGHLKLAASLIEKPKTKPAL